MRTDNRTNEQLRPIKMSKDYIMHPEGSVLIEFGNTKVICNATIEDSVPPFKRGSGSGWITAEYSMLPRATGTRVPRDIQKLRLNNRSVEIQRLIGRSLRAAIDLDLLGERAIMIDCDVIQADGGTRTASITGGFVALYLACDRLVKNKVLKKSPIVNFVSAVSVGIVQGVGMLDLCYEEDSRADVDMNLVMTDKNEFVEIQGTGENNTFNVAQLNELLALGMIGNKKLIEAQKQLLGID